MSNRTANKTVTYVPLGADPVPYSEVEQHMEEYGFTYAGGYENGTSYCCGSDMSTQLFTKRGPEGLTIYRRYHVCPKCNLAYELKRKEVE